MAGSGSVRESAGKDRGGPGAHPGQKVMLCQDGAPVHPPAEQPEAVDAADAADIGVLPPAQWHDGRHDSAYSAPPNCCSASAAL